MTYIEFLAFIVSDNYKICGWDSYDLHRYFLDNWATYRAQAQSRSGLQLLRHINFHISSALRLTAVVVFELEMEVRK